MANHSLSLKKKQKKKTKRTRVFPYGVGIGAESPWRGATETSIGSWLAVWECVYIQSNKSEKKVAWSWNGHRWSSEWRWFLTQTCVWLSAKLAKCVVNWWFKWAPLSVLCVPMQLASTGTFQVLKLPLGFIRVLEWVSFNFDVGFFVACNNLCGVNNISEKYAQCKKKNRDELQCALMLWGNIWFWLDQFLRLPGAT